jgi:hypothetical protein
LDSRLFNEGADGVDELTLFGHKQQTDEAEDRNAEPGCNFARRSFGWRLGKNRKFAENFRFGFLRRIIEDENPVSPAGLKKVHAGHVAEFGRFAAADLPEFEHFQGGHQPEVMVEFGTCQVDRHLEVFRDGSRKFRRCHGDVQR